MATPAWLTQSSHWRALSAASARLAAPSASANSVSSVGGLGLHLGQLQVGALEAGLEREDFIEVIGRLAGAAERETRASLVAPLARCVCADVRSAETGRSEGMPEGDSALPAETSRLAVTARLDRSKRIARRSEAGPRAEDDEDDEDGRFDRQVPRTRGREGEQRREEKMRREENKDTGGGKRSGEQRSSTACFEQ
ncbi:hypothetical protein TOPH_02153 [Tolypocladium ophioglossoides CBS 100239]|uniref:Uncharacterized protein n=1 Tax=Tolypocladium ophioglossoides (strain CBS 100239) TaxID=1163406 RepID=A0A0L0NG44_TOLOC|nr:hypothetical protein TOPH_02153 [Tolypocladium ophioglossoides CBS 100239]